MMFRGENANFWSRKELINIVQEGKFWGKTQCNLKSEYIGVKIRYSVADKENFGAKT